MRAWVSELGFDLFKDLPVLLLIFSFLSPLEQLFNFLVILFQKLQRIHFCFCLLERFCLFCRRKTNATRLAGFSSAGSLNRGQENKLFL
jgi:hypothetical protein